MMKNKIIPTNQDAKKEKYEAPVIESVDIRVEQGFQASFSSLGSDPNLEDEASF